MTSLMLALTRRSRLGLLPFGVLVLLGTARCTGSNESRGPKADNGQTGSVGSAECQVDADCQHEADSIVAQLASEGRDAAVRSAECVSGGLCDTVLRNDGKCYVDSPYGEPYDCGLSDAEILQAEAARQEELATCGGKGCVEAPKPVYHPRDPKEWDGMPVLLDGPPCEQSEYCGLALACIDEKCGACTVDQDCAPGEGCVVEHCLKTELIGCHSYRDCSPALCILSGLTGGTPRGNEEMTSYCQ